MLARGKLAERQRFEKCGNPVAMVTRKVTCANCLSRFANTKTKNKRFLLLPRTRDTSQCTMKILPNGGPCGVVRLLVIFYRRFFPTRVHQTCFYHRGLDFTVCGAWLQVFLWAEIHNIHIQKPTRNLDTSVPIWQAPGNVWKTPEHPFLKEQKYPFSETATKI